MHLYSTATSPERLNHSLSPALASIINKMIEKSAKKRFANWDEIIELLNKQGSCAKTHSSVVMKAITARNLEIEAQKKEESLKLQKKQEEEKFKKKILSQFECDIISPLEEFIEDFNEQYAGEPIHGYFSDRYNNRNCFSYELMIDDKRFIKIDMLNCPHDLDSENNYESYDYWYEESQYSKKNAKLTYKGKNVWTFGIVKNHNDLGFNIILVDNDDIYGDWYILNNKNSSYGFISGEFKKEPFYLPYEEIQEVLDKTAYLYDSEIRELNKQDYLSLIENLAFEK